MIPRLLTLLLASKTLVEGLLEPERYRDIDPIPFVNLFHGSAGAGGVGGWASSEVPVAANFPFGAMRLGADTTVCYEGLDFWWIYNHYGGYYYNDTCIRAFSHTKMQGTGLGDAGSLGVSIVRQPVASLPLPTALAPAPYMSRFSHDNESAAPGYYSALLVDLANASLTTLAEVTVAGERSGLHRYTCLGGGSACNIVLDLCHSNDDRACGAGALALEARADGGVLLRASMLMNGAFGGDCGGVRVFAVAAISAATVDGAPLAAAASGVWVDGERKPGAANASSTGESHSLGAFAEFSAADVG